MKNAFFERHVGMWLEGVYDVCVCVFVVVHRCMFLFLCVVCIPLKREKESFDSV